MKNKEHIAILGCGWLGIPLAKILLQSGYLVHGSTTTPAKIPHLQKWGIRPFLIRINDHLTGPIHQFLQCQTLIINLPPGRRDPNVTTQYPKRIHLLLNNLANTLVQQIIFISATSVYGQQQGICTEDSPLTPNTNSGKALVAAEKLVLDFSVPTTILRLSGLIGPDRHPALFLAGKKDLKRALAPVNLVQQADVIDVIHAILSQNKFGYTYNVCADEHPTRKDYYTAQALQLGLIPPTFDDRDHSQGKVISNTKIKQELNIVFHGIELT